MDSRGTVQRAVKLAQDDLKAQDQESLCIGDLVVLTGLKKASHYNGQYAIVSGQAKGERLPVRLIENREKTLAARPSNLLKATSIKSAEARDTSKVQAVLAKRLPPPFRSDFLYVPPPLTKVRAPRGAEGGVASGNGSSSSRGAQIILSNILILLPGLGDTAAPYRKFAASMELPQTGCVSLRPPLPIPLDMGYQWFESFEPDMNLIQPKKGEKRRIRSLQKSRSILHDAIGAIRATFNLPLSRIFLFGFSQGGIVCVDTALNPPLGGLSGRIGGVIAVSSSLLEEFEEAAEGEEEEEEGKRGEGRGANDSNGEAKKQIEHIRRSTPFLITHGTLDRRVPLETARSSVARLKRLLGSPCNKAGSSSSSSSSSSSTFSVLGEAGETEQPLIYKEYKKGHTMIGSRDEARDLHQFFAKHLFLRNVAMENHPDLIDVAKHPEILEQLSTGTRDLHLNK